MSTVLVVEDDEQLRDLFADVLADNGYTIRTAEDGLQPRCAAERQYRRHCVRWDDAEEWTGSP